MCTLESGWSIRVSVRSIRVFHKFEQLPLNETIGLIVLVKNQIIS